MGVVELDVPPEDVDDLHEGGGQVQEIEELVVHAEGIEDVQRLVGLEFPPRAPFGVDPIRCLDEGSDLGLRQDPWDDEEALVVELPSLLFRQTVLEAGLIHR